VHHLHKRTTGTRVRLLFGALVPPLPQEIPVPIKNSDAAVAVSIGYVNISILWIDGDIGGPIKLHVARVHSPSFERTIGAIDNPSLSDLHHQCTVMTVFLNDSVAVPGSPEVVFVVDGAAVGRVRNRLPVAEAVHHLAIGIELNKRRCLPGDFSLLTRHVVPINNKHMILAVHADAAHLAG
jgi:hypothetical protein